VISVFGVSSRLAGDGGGGLVFFSKKKILFIPISGESVKVFTNSGLMEAFF